MLNNSLQITLEELLAGKTVICSDNELDSLQAALNKNDSNNYIRSLVNPNRIGTKDRWQCWIRSAKYDTEPVKL
jgi:hypothetical protein